MLYLIAILIALLACIKILTKRNRRRRNTTRKRSMFDKGGFRR